MILAEELKRVYQKLDKVISVEDNLKEFIEEYNNKLEKQNKQNNYKFDKVGYFND